VDQTQVVGSDAIRQFGVGGRVMSRF